MSDAIEDPAPPHDSRAAGGRLHQLCSPSGVEAVVCEDIAKRQQVGINKYGMTVAENPLSLREWLHHAYEECLDQAVYLRRAMDALPKPPRDCRKCGGDGVEEIQSGPYTRKCSACGGSGKENE